MRAQDPRLAQLAAALRDAASLDLSQDAFAVVSPLNLITLELPQPLTAGSVSHDFTSSGFATLTQDFVTGGDATICILRPGLWRVALLQRLLASGLNLSSPTCTMKLRLIANNAVTSLEEPLMATAGTTNGASAGMLSFPLFVPRDHRVDILTTIDNPNAGATNKVLNTVVASRII